MGGIIDTNILLYGPNQDAEEHRSATNFLHRTISSRDAWFLTEGICYEFLRVATHPKVFDRPLVWKEALHFLQPFFWHAHRRRRVRAGLSIAYSPST